MPKSKSTVCLPLSTVLNACAYMKKHIAALRQQDIEEGISKCQERMNKRVSWYRRPRTRTPATREEALVWARAYVERASKSEFSLGWVPPEIENALGGNNYSESEDLISTVRHCAEQAKKAGATTMVMSAADMAHFVPEAFDK